MNCDGLLNMFFKLSHHLLLLVRERRKHIHEVVVAGHIVHRALARLEYQIYSLLESIVNHAGQQVFQQF